jgi:hypothetical protein
MGELTISFSRDEDDLRSILKLQSINLRSNLSKEEMDSQGFLLVRHSFDTLKEICDTEPAVIAKDGSILAGYAISMSKEHSFKVPELHSFFESLRNLSYRNTSLSESNFIICGQICIAKEYRGINLMRALYFKMRELSTVYDYCVTEVSSQNIRSLHAHYKVGFKPLYEHKKEAGELWHILLWDWK